MSSRWLPLAPAASGVLAWLALPDRNVWPLGFVALAPLAAFAVRSSPGRAFLGGWLGGLLLYVLAMPWVIGVMTQYGGLPGAVAVSVSLLLHGYLACYWGLWSWLLSRLASASPGRALAAPLLWVGLEWLRSWLFSGFPWIPMALSVWSVPALAQHAAWGGVYTVSGLVVTGSAAGAALVSRPTRRVGVLLATVLAIASGTGALWLAAWDARLSVTPRSLPVGVVQAMVPLEERWDPAERARIEEAHAVMSAELVGQGAKAVIWSESSISAPGGYFGNAIYARKMAALTQMLRAPVLFGGTSRERTDTGERIFNSAFVVAADGRFAARYDKQHLVPFGEYVPAQRLLFFAEKLVHEVGDFGRGSGPELVPLGPVRAGVPICYEIIFPEIARAFVGAGAEILVTITNDAWFGRTAAPEQHFAHAVFRAVETRRFVVRCANTGISGIVSPAGRVEVRTPIFESAKFVAPVAPLTGLTPYARTGDLIPAAGLALAAVVAVRRPRPRPAKPS